MALNLPAPIKPRLEYPIPKDYYGITPGWLRALHYQMKNNEFISYKLLWDRWMGVCLRTETLVEILCLGGFTNNLGIPWIRFVAICAAHLTAVSIDLLQNTYPLNTRWLAEFNRNNDINLRNSNGRTGRRRRHNFRRSISGRLQVFGVYRCIATATPLQSLLHRFRARFIRKNRKSHGGRES